ncbi:hypothetical protein E2C01_052653 [Portunus trituberculatus]|uniref:Uncharacterized protein n=1 Tax=Portunus trituberculatus TaxID=210409 RepID=A0A5B7GM89_PORTR|nr:hypothetical protein [Portunus trituberculatus]
MIKLPKYQCHHGARASPPASSRPKRDWIATSLGRLTVGVKLNWIPALKASEHPDIVKGHGFGRCLPASHILPLHPPSSLLTNFPDQP